MGAGCNLDDRFALGIHLARGKLLVGLDSGLVLLQASLVRVADPIELPLERLLPLRFFLFDHAEQFRFLLEPRGVVSLERQPPRVVQLQDPRVTLSRK